MASNIDVALLVAGLDNDFNLRRIERYLAIAMSSEITPVVVLNKADLADDVDGRLVAVDAIAPGVATVAVSARTGQGLDDLRAHLLPGTTAAILGSSGVGKSTLVNALLGEDRQATAEVRDSDSRGRHTTTHRELFELPGGALLVDTPGIRALEVLGAEEGVETAFDDVADIAATCRFSDCRHNGEPGCAVQAALADGTLSRGAAGQSPEARTRARPRRPRGRSTSQGRVPTHLEAHPQERRGTDEPQVRRGDPMTATRSIRSVTLEDAPAIPGLTARHFHDASDYESLSELTIAASLEDGVPYLPTAQNLQVEMDTADGADPVDDMVLVELDGRVVAASGVERVVRGDVPNYQIWGTVHPDVRRRGIGTALLGWNLARARVRASREDPLVRVELASFSEDSEIGPARAADQGRLRDRPALLPDAPGRARRHPGCAPPRRHRDPPGHRGPVADDHRRPRTRPSATTGVTAR